MAAPAMPPTSARRLTISEAARRLGMSMPALRYHCRPGKTLVMDAYGTVPEEDLARLPLRPNRVRAPYRKPVRSTLPANPREAEMREGIELLEKLCHELHIEPEVFFSPANTCQMQDARAAGVYLLFQMCFSQAAMRHIFDLDRTSIMRRKERAEGQLKKGVEPWWHHAVLVLLGDDDLQEDEPLPPKALKPHAIPQLIAGALPLRVTGHIRAAVIHYAEHRLYGTRALPGRCLCPTAILALRQDAEATQCITAALKLYDLAGHAYLVLKDIS